MPNIKAKAVTSKPYKLYAAIVSAFLSSLIAQQLDQPAWAVGVETAIVAALAVFITPNPIEVTEVDHNEVA